MAPVLSRAQGLLAPRVAVPAESTRQFAPLAEILLSFR